MRSPTGRTSTSTSVTATIRGRPPTTACWLSGSGSLPACCGGARRPSDAILRLTTSVRGRSPCAGQTARRSRSAEHAQAVAVDQRARRAVVEALREAVVLDARQARPAARDAHLAEAREQARQLLGGHAVVELAEIVVAPVRVPPGVGEVPGDAVQRRPAAAGDPDFAPAVVVGALLVQHIAAQETGRDRPGAAERHQ